MEEGINTGSTAGKIRDTFGLGKVDIRTYSPLTLAFIGDSVYELLVRTILVEEGNRPVNALNKKKVRMVRAGAQSDLLERIKEKLTPEEEKIYLRGRNAHSHTMAKNASVLDYRRATGFEALCGYLYLTGQSERLLSLIRDGLEMNTDEKR